MTKLAPAVVFDLDGTLTDSQTGIVRSARYALERLNAADGADFPIPPEREMTWIVGPPLRGTFAKLVGAERAERALGFFRERYSTIGLFENAPYDGVVAALEDLAARGYRRFVATSKVEVDARRILDHFDLTRHFDGVYGSEVDGGRSVKRDLLAYLLARERAGAPQRAVMIGDRRFDVEGARAVGLPTIGALWGYGGAEELAAAGADPLIETPQEIPAAVAMALARAAQTTPRES